MAVFNGRIGFCIALIDFMKAEWLALFVAVGDIRRFSTANTHSLGEEYPISGSSPSCTSQKIGAWMSPSRNTLFN